MADRNEIMNMTLKRLKSVKNLKEFKAAEKDITGLVEKIMKTAIEEIKAYLENVHTMTTEMKQAETLKFHSEDFLIRGDVMQEVDRLNNLPGAGKYAESFSLKLEKIMGTYLSEYEELQEKLMANIMENLFEDNG